VAYTIDYPKARELAERNDIPLLEADREPGITGKQPTARIEGSRALQHPRSTMSCGY
jgi:hypothetical protein